MKYLAIFVFLFFSMFPPVHAEAEIHDGWWWISMGHIAKGYFLEGFEVGAKEASQNQNYFYLKRDKHMKVINGLDLFYKDTLNKDIHFHVAIFIVLQKIGGQPIGAIKKLIKRARKYPSRIPKISY